MGLISDTKLGKIEFCEQHVAAWVANSVAMGSSVPVVAAWNAKVTDVRAKYEAQKAAEIAARDANIDCNDALALLMDATAAIIGQVRSQSKLIGNSAWSLASLPIPATPSPVGELGQPNKFKVTIDPITGALTIAWKNTNPKGATGVVYQIWRRLGATGELTYLGGTGEKQYNDNTIPTATSQVTYQIQAVRSTSTGPWAECTIKFGSGSNGIFAASVIEGTPSKLAA